jgi:hypothetical protein
MVDDTTRPFRPSRGRVNRHRPEPAPAPAPTQDPATPPAEPAPAPVPARPPRRAPELFVHDRTRAAVRRPAQISDHCAGCGASTRGRTLMATELVEIGGVRVMRVVACSECSDRRRRDLMA